MLVDEDAGVRKFLDAVDVAVPPAAGLWRVGRQPSPLKPSILDRRRGGPPDRAGNRWDSPDFGVLYLATSLEGCYGEILARHRPEPSLAALVAPEWTYPRYMEPGQIARDWRDRRVAVNVRVGRYIFLDIESLKTRLYVQNELKLPLAALGVSDLDVAAVRGSDRRVTQLIAEWAHDLAFGDDETVFSPVAGIRYESRVSSDWECWAAFDDIDFSDYDAYPVEATDPSLVTVATQFGLTVH